MEKIYINCLIEANIKKTWDAYNDPESIKKWNQASPDWHCPSSENHLRVGGKFKNRMEAKDGSFGFDFEGEYTHLVPYHLLEYKMTDGREVKIVFQEEEQNTIVRIEFDSEELNSLEMQKQGWKAILNSFKGFVENN